MGTVTGTNGVHGVLWSNKVYMSHYFVYLGNGHITWYFSVAQNQSDI